MKLKMSEGRNGFYARICIFSVSIFYLICHLFILMNPSYSHDSLLIVACSDNAHQISLGRFLQPLYRAIRGNVTAPWLISALSIVFLSLTLYLIVIILDFKSVLAIILSAGILTTNTTVIFSNATYLPWVDIYALALLMATLAAFFSIRFRYGFILGGVCLFCSLGLYQSFITVTIGIIMLLTIKLVLEKARFEVVRDTILAGIFSIFLGLIFYLIGTHISNLIVPASDAYNSLNNVGDGLLDRGLIDIIKLLLNTYFMFAVEIIWLIKDRIVITILALLFIGAITIGLVYKWVKEEKIFVSWIIFAIIVVLLLPFGLNANYFISGNSVYHSLMNYGCFLIYLLPIMIYDLCGSNVQESEWGACNKNIRNKFYKTMVMLLPVFVCVIIYNNIVFANGVYTEKYLQASMTFSTMTRVVDRIEEVDGFTPGETPIAIIGELNDSMLMSQTSEFDTYSGIGTAPNRFSVTHRDTYTQYLSYILGYPLAEITETEEQTLKGNIQVVNMPTFPHTGSCAIIDGYMVIKLSEYDQSN